MPETVDHLQASESRLVIPNDLAALRPMSRWLEECVRAHDAPEQLAFNFDLCANEAVTNIISYAYPDDGRREIRLRCFREDGALCLEIEDDGIPYDPLARPEHAQPDSLDDAGIGGLGVDLIRSFMDECRYARRNGRNVLTLVARLAA
jgi:anti-sigma regulatory factor (Ser/Thr protein kinase)